MIKAVIFDFDGLLVDSEPMWYKARKEVFAQFNMEWTWEHQINTMGVSTQFWVDYIHNILKEHLTKEQILEGVTSSLRELYIAGEVKAMEGAEEALEYCKDTNFLTGLASGSYKELLFAGVDVKNWRGYFKEIISSDDMERGKPAPDIYLEMCKRLDVKPEEAVVLEDSRDGMKAGIAAGCKVIGIPNKEIEVPQEVLNQCVKVISSLKDFPETLKELD